MLYLPKQPKLELKTWPKQLISYLSLDIVLPISAIIVMLALL
jgi:hypothetical protein